jgi:hypothetical protein
MREIFIIVVLLFLLWFFFRKRSQNAANKAQRPFGKRRGGKPPITGVPCDAPPPWALGAR